jgi:predicted RNA-binding protein (virulence factor B family)
MLEGIVSRFVSAGIYIRFDLGIEGLLKSAEGLAGISQGEKVQVRVSSFEPNKERLDLQWAQPANVDQQL